MEKQQNEAKTVNQKPVIWERKSDYWLCS